MIKRRDFLEKITGSDAFAELSFEAQALYFQLSMAADDEGFVSSPKKIQRGIGASYEALVELAECGYILLEEGFCGIAHWEASDDVEDAADRMRAATRERVRRFRAKQKEEAIETSDAEDVAVTETENTEDVTLCNADVTPCNVTVTLHTVTQPSPSFLPLSSPSLSSPTPLSITPPIIPLISSPSQKSSSSLFLGRAQEISLKYWGRKLRKYEKEELRALSLDLAEEREGTEAGELCLNDDDIRLLDIAFAISADAGVCNLTYLRGIYERWHDHGIYAPSDYFEHEIKRETAHGIVSRHMHLSRGVVGV